MHKIINAFCIKKTTLGGEFFKKEHDVEEYIELPKEWAIEELEQMGE